MKQLFFTLLITSIAAITQAQSWNVTGNVGTADGTHFLGTTDARPLNFRISNQVAGRIDSFNLFMGFKAGGKANGAVTRNTAIGSQALSANTTGVFNTAIGNSALTANTEGSYNVATGTSALFVNTQGTGNTASGYAALYANTIGNYNVASGGFSLFSNVGGTNNTAIGYTALYTNNTGHNNVGIGFSALRLNSTGANNVASGYSALNNNNGDDNVAVGFKSLYSNTIGSSNTAVGNRTLFSNIDGARNIAIGQDALYINQNGFSNVAIGTAALYSNSGFSSLNTAVGESALAGNTTASANAAFGASALWANNSGGGNTASGYKALYYNYTGNFNTAVGSEALLMNDNGNLNSAFGFRASMAKPTNGSKDISNSTAIGSYATATADYQVKIGSEFVSTIGGRQFWSIISDGNYKRDIKENVPGLDFIKILRPVTYRLKIGELIKLQGLPDSIAQTKEVAQRVAQIEGETQTGLIAQEVKEAARLVNYDCSSFVHTPQNDKDNYSLAYDALIMPLIKAVQEQQQQIEELKTEIKTLKQSQSYTFTKTSGTTAQLSIYPNPTKDGFTIQLPLNSAGKMFAAYDINGKQIMNNIISNTDNNNLYINTQTWTKGTYTIVIKETTGNVSASGKVIKE